MSRTMPKQKPYRSEQTVVTPMEFVMAVERKLGVGAFYIDLAASEDNTRAPRFFTFEDNALAQNWARAILTGQWAWLNPPYSDIRPWVEKACKSGKRVVVLVPASVGSNWWRDWVHEKAYILLLNGRITFEGHKAGYPKDLALLVYGLEPGYDIWDWRRS